jgi:hypothetical protein
VAPAATLSASSARRAKVLAATATMKAHAATATIGPRIPLTTVTTKGSIGHPSGVDVVIGLRPGRLELFTDYRRSSNPHRSPGGPLSMSLVRLLQDNFADFMIARDMRCRRLAVMSDSNPDDTRRVEVHFALDDQALVLEISESAEGQDVDELIEALQAADIDDAEHRLQRTATGAKAIGRLGSYRRW